MEGQVLGGKYRVEKLLGQGGMGSVYLAENPDIGRKVAIKLLRAQYADDPETLTRFKNEARAAAAIGHPGIVEVLDMGTTEDGSPYIVMERLVGETLRERLQRERTLPPLEAGVLVARVLDILAAAHDKGVIHRDLKPDNLFLQSDPVGGLKILDFGISKFKAMGDVQVTRTNTVMGTPLYMSPEQAKGAKDVNFPSDLYSMGAILYEAMSGQPPFPGESYNEVLARVLTEPLRPLHALRPDIPPDLAAALYKLLEKEPHARFSNARAAALALRSTIPVSSGGTSTVPWVTTGAYVPVAPQAQPLSLYPEYAQPTLPPQTPYVPPVGPVHISSPGLIGDTTASAHPVTHDTPHVVAPLPLLVQASNVLSAPDPSQQAVVQKGQGMSAGTKVALGIGIGAGAKVAIGLLLLATVVGGGCLVGVGWWATHGSSGTGTTIHLEAHPNPRGPDPAYGRAVNAGDVPGQ
jgi:serine/threonine-protein kinase